MLPMARRIDEVAKFIALVQGRARTSLLLETRESLETIEQIVRLDGLDELHVGNRLGPADDGDARLCSRASPSRRARDSPARPSHETHAHSPQRNLRRIAINQGIVVPEEMWKHRRFVPAQAIKMRIAESEFRRRIPPRRRSAGATPTAG